MFFKKKEHVDVFADLDAILAKPVWFRLHGRERQIKPITVKEFFLYSNALAEFYALKDKPEVTNNELIDVAFKLSKSVCDDIERVDIERMSQAQWAALFSLIMETVTGKAHVEKKTLKISPGQ